MKHIKRFGTAIGGVAVIAAAVWGFFYSFHYFPFESTEFEWWYIPTVLSTGGVAIFFIIISAAFIEWGQR
ncbi:MAG: hypothetical protein WA003_15675 [Desulfuromonadaceae bacterium]